MMALNRLKPFLFQVWILLLMCPRLIGSVEDHFPGFSAFADETYYQCSHKFPERHIPNTPLFNNALKPTFISDNKSHPVSPLYHGQVSFPFSNTSKDDGGGPTLMPPLLNDRGRIISFFPYSLIPEKTPTPENDHEFDGFIQGLQQKIKAKWQPLDNDNDYQIIVRFEVNRQGEVSHFKYLKASPNPEANRRALEAVYSAAPFRGFPNSYQKKDFVNVEFVFDYKLHHSGSEGASANSSQYKDILGYGESHKGWKSLRTFQLVASKHPISLKIYVEQNSLENDFYKPSYLRLVSESLQEWQNALNNRFTYQWVNSTQESEIQINWVDSFSEKGKTKEDIKNYVGRTLPAIGKGIIRIRAKNFSEPQVKRIILHELGHALGLSIRNSHSLDPDDIMSSGRGLYHCGSRLIPSPHLSIRDKAAIQRLYSPQWEKGEDLYQAISAQYPSKISPTACGNSCH
ncbi:MAG: TonB C-terminal domain-containing protein [Cyanobacteria bacterium]|nr:TonB C-terminal domain-containing protein [Cyanobacteriota bacterium]